MSYAVPNPRRSYHRQPRLRPHAQPAADSTAPHANPHLRASHNQLASAPDQLLDKRALAKRGLRIGRTAVGKGLFATKRIVDGCCIGEIQGLVISDDEYVSRYAFDLDDGRQLEPAAPFRFVNHCCAPNCAFQNFAFPAVQQGVPTIPVAASQTTPGSGGTLPLASPSRKLLLFSICDIEIGQELTIDYNWPAIFAIPCACRSDQCRGWIVAPKDLPQLIAGFQPEEIDGCPMRSA